MFITKATPPDETIERAATKVSEASVVISLVVMPVFASISAQESSCDIIFMILV